MGAIADTFDQLVTYGKAHSHVDCLLGFHVWIGNHDSAVPAVWRDEILDKLSGLWELYRTDAMARPDMPRYAANSISDFEKKPDVATAVKSWAHSVQLQDGGLPRYKQIIGLLQP